MTRSLTETGWKICAPLQRNMKRISSADSRFRSSPALNTPNGPNIQFSHRPTRRAEGSARDSDFLSRTAQRGFKLAWCAEAPVHEAVPPRRLEADWIRARSLRNGVISTLVEKKKRAGTPLANVRVFAKSLALLAASPFRALARLARTGSPAIGVYPIHVALGRVLAEFGYANEQYRQPEKN
jgi:hypothetical protein